MKLGGIPSHSQNQPFNQFQESSNPNSNKYMRTEKLHHNFDNYSNKVNYIYFFK